MALLRLRFLGTFQVEMDGAPVTAFRSNKTRALLAYLALNGERSHSRDALATLFWGDSTQSAARASLRQAIANLRQVVAPLLDVQPSVLSITRHALQLHADHPAVWVDALAFRRLLAQVQDHAHPDVAGCPRCRAWLEEATSLYHGDFLAGLWVDGAPEFTDWRLLQQESLHQQVLLALRTLSASHAAIHDLAAQADTLRRLLHLQPWQEETHRELMDVLARTGQRAAALAQYQRCCQALAEELGVEPSPETTALYRLIQAETPSLEALPRPATQEPLPHNLPPPVATPLIGRDDLLAQGVAALTQADTRLLTLLGPGGVGKTRLALAAARQAIPAFEGGVWFVPLADAALPAQSVDARQSLAGTVADHLGLTLQRPGDPWQTLTAYLGHKRALLVLDNLEHLLPAATGFVTELLDAAPGITVLVTSQIRLRCRIERVLPVEGLPTPEPGSLVLETALTNGSIALFAERAGRTLSGFQLTPDNLPAVAEICRQLDGLPLAVELTAALTDHFTPQELAAALQEDLALLAESPGAADLPPRQRSMQAVFDYAWGLLTPQEQEMLAQLSLFRGEFGRDMALAVSQGSLAGLAGLVDKSLLQVARPGRYALHGLVRRFATRALEERPALHAATSNRFVQTYAAFLAHQLPHLRGPGQHVALAALRQELENIRRAWGMAAAEGQVDALSAMLPPLVAFLADSGRLATGHALFTEAAQDLARLEAQQGTARLLARLELWDAFFVGEMGQMERAVTRLETLLPRLEQMEESVAWAHCLRILGSFETQLGRLDQGIARLEEALQAFESAGDTAALAQTLSALGHARELQGEYGQARDVLAQSVAMLRTLGAPQSLARGLSHYGLLRHRLGDYQEAEAALREAAALNEEGGNPPALGASLANLGLVLAAQGQPARAQALFERALAIQRNEGNRIRVAILFNNLGDVANAQGRHEEALAYLQESLAIKQEMGDERGQVFSLVHLGHTHWRLERPAAALAAYREALILAQRLDMKPLILAAFAGLADMALTWSQTGLAQEMLRLAATHPASWRRVRDEARTVAARHRVSLEEATTEPLPDLDETVRQALRAIANRVFFGGLFHSA